MLIVLKEKKNTALISHLQKLIVDKFGCASHMIGNNERVMAVTGDTSVIDVELLKISMGQIRRSRGSTV